MKTLMQCPNSTQMPGQPCQIATLITTMISFWKQWSSNTRGSVVQEQRVGTIHTQCRAQLTRPTGMEEPVLGCHDGIPSNWLWWEILHLDNLPHSSRKVQVATLSYGFAIFLQWSQFQGHGLRIQPLMALDPWKKTFFILYQYIYIIGGQHPCQFWWLLSSTFFNSRHHEYWDSGLHWRIQNGGKGDITNRI